MKQVSKQ